MRLSSARPVFNRHYLRQWNSDGSFDVDRPEMVRTVEAGPIEVKLLFKLRTDCILLRLQTQ